MSEDASKSGESSRESNVDLPPQRIDLPLKSQITTKSKQPDLPVDVLLLTANDKGFLACYKELNVSFRRYFDETAYVYFSHFVGHQQGEVKVALMKCYEGADVPGGSLITVMNAASLLQPKAIISVGACSGLDPENTKLGDVVVSAKIATLDHEIRTFVSKRFLRVILHGGDGWKAPHPSIKVHLGEFLSGSVLRAECLRNALERYPKAMAIETGGDGMYIIFLFPRDPPRIRIFLKESSRGGGGNSAYERGGDARRLA